MDGKIENPNSVKVFLWKVIRFEYLCSRQLIYSRSLSNAEL